jgi:hypothetical protein
VVEKYIDDETDKVDDTEIDRDDQGRMKIFEYLASAEDPRSVDVLTT